VTTDYFFLDDFLADFFAGFFLEGKKLTSNP